MKYKTIPIILGGLINAIWEKLTEICRRNVVLELYYNFKQKGVNAIGHTF